MAAVSNQCLLFQINACCFKSMPAVSTFFILAEKNTLNYWVIKCLSVAVVSALISHREIVGSSLVRDNSRSPPSLVRYLTPSEDRFLFYLPGLFLVLSLSSLCVCVWACARPYHLLVCQQVKENTDTITISLSVSMPRWDYVLLSDDATAALTCDCDQETQKTDSSCSLVLDLKL